MKENESNKDVSPLTKALSVFLVVLFLPIVIIVAVSYLLWGFALTVLIWILWGLRGRYILFVYSNSPIWLEYIEQKILPNIYEKAVILNWSERKMWKSSLAVFAFRYFGGSKDFNPMAIVFRPLMSNKVFRFYEAFHELKHGKPEKFEALNTDFLKYIEL